MTSSEETCAVCGRTILAGEQTRAYLDREGGQRSVCELCRARAEQLGWIWEEIAEGRPAEPARRRRARLGDLWRRGGERRQGEAHPPDPPAADPSPDPAAAGARTERLEPDPAPSPLSPFERAVARFNASEAARTVAGLMRSLGEPWVSIGAAAGSPSEVRITVAWELTWYQWGVDLADELRPLAQLDKGSEVSQLDSSARQWNASAAAGGQLLLGTPAGESARRGEPVG